MIYLKIIVYIKSINNIQRILEYEMARIDIFDEELVPPPPVVSPEPEKIIKLIGRVEEELLLNIFNNIQAPQPKSVGKEVAVVFHVQPNITESGSVNYVEINNIRQAASLLIYRGSPSRTFSINATFVSRTKEEAAQTLKYVNILRSWRMPEEKTSIGGLNVPSAPSRLRLSGLNKQFKNIPVRMIDLSIPLTDETDYIVTPNGAVPIVWEISMTLKESKSISDLNAFDILKFRKGDLDGW